MNSSENFGSSRIAAIIAAFVIDVMTQFSIAVVVAMRSG